jgi:hypothetical protein
MTTSDERQGNRDEVDLMEIVRVNVLHPTDNAWSGWANDALRALKPATDVGGDVMQSVKQWALAAKGAVTQCWGGWTSPKKAIEETREVPNNRGLVRVEKPVELSLDEKRLLKASLVKCIANEKQDLSMDRD